LKLGLFKLFFAKNGDFKWIFWKVNQVCAKKCFFVIIYRDKSGKTPMPMICYRKLKSRVSLKTHLELQNWQIRNFSQVSGF
jgi:hypothetical protein